MSQFQFETKNRGGNSLIFILIAVAVIFGFYFITKSLFSLLTVVAPALLIGALIVNHNVVINYVKYIFKSFQSSPVWGVILTLITIFAYPVVAAFLMMRAWSRREGGILFKKKDEGNRKEYVSFEEVEEDVETLELPDLNKRKEKSEMMDEGDYEQLFD